jgi:hypothetical protein
MCCPQCSYIYVIFVSDFKKELVRLSIFYDVPYHPIFHIFFPLQFPIFFFTKFHSSSQVHDLSSHILFKIFFFPLLFYFCYTFVRALHYTSLGSNLCLFSCSQSVKSYQAKRQKVLHDNSLKIKGLKMAGSRLKEEGRA